MRFGEEQFDEGYDGAIFAKSFVELWVGGEIADEPSGGMCLFLLTFEQIQRVFETTFSEDAYEVLFGSGHVGKCPDGLSARGGRVAVDEPHKVVQ